MTPHLRKGILLCPSQSWRDSVNIDISEYSMSIKHLIFDTCTELNLPESQIPLLKHKSQWNQTVILISPCHDNHTGEYCFWLVSPLTYQDKDSSSILALMQEVIGDRCMHGNVYFLQNLSENSADRIVPHILKTAPG